MNKQPEDIESWKDQVVEAARKLVYCRGRYHSELNMKALIELFKKVEKKG